MTQAELMQAALEAHWKYVAESHAMDVAFAEGRLSEWVTERHRKGMEEFRNGGSNGRPTAGGNTGTAAE